MQMRIIFFIFSQRFRSKTAFHFKNSICHRLIMNTVHDSFKFSFRFLMKTKIRPEYFFIFAAGFGGLAQLARAFDWQSKGHRFDSDILHADN
jgi:hypothetical protein